MDNNPVTSPPDEPSPEDDVGDGRNSAPGNGGETSTPTGGSSSAVLASRLSLRTTIMWLVSALLVVAGATMVVVSPKMGAFAIATLLALVGTARLVIPGTPFGLSARNRFWDVSFCYAVALAIVILTNSAHSLK
ncbi:DUF3017 domain-containing protein [Jonesiaceae bacterium BS-20]|uniref:DUF3017 domain-containing protein n=1 Tax=Jonesiaceae bacterium BS-20 TaxID=3120821 RepID=A0AAU7DY17_9MICO